MLSRRSFHGLALAAAAAPLVGAKPDSKIKGVRIGAQTYSFRDRPLDEAIKGMADVGLSYAELWSGHIEPPRGTSPEELTKWRTAPATLQQMKEVRRKFNEAGIRIYALSYNIRKQHTDPEIRAIFQMAKELGTKYVTSSSTVDQAPRLSALAQQAGVLVAVHNHSNLKDPNEFATPESFEKAMSGNPAIRVNLDIGHFTAADFDPVQWLKQHHEKVVTLHIKDRKKGQGPNVPFGQGDTPIREVLALLKEHRWPIPAMIEYEYKGGDTVEEVRKSYQYVREALIS
jgi:sugar phosphate isomerase/epimerase